MNEITKTYQLHGNERKATAKLWEKHGKRIVYFNDNRGKSLASYDLDKQEWREGKKRSDFLYQALEAAFADDFKIWNADEMTEEIEEPSEDRHPVEIEAEMYGEVFQAFTEYLGGADQGYFPGAHNPTWWLREFAKSLRFATYGTDDRNYAYGSSFANGISLEWGIS